MPLLVNDLLTIVTISVNDINSLVKETARIESSNNDKAIGDKGKSRGRYQIQEATWKRYSKKPWKIYAHDRKESTRVVRLILKDCIKKCGNKPSFQRIRYYYTHGGF